MGTTEKEVKKREYARPLTHLLGRTFYCNCVCRLLLLLLLSSLLLLCCCIVFLLFVVSDVTYSSSSCCLLHFLHLTSTSQGRLHMYVYVCVCVCVCSRLLFVLPMGVFPAPLLILYARCPFWATVTSAAPSLVVVPFGSSTRM